MITLNFDIDIRQNAKEIVFSDITGIYNANTNPGGYGTPNVPIDEITLTKLIIVFPNKKKYILSSTFLPEQGQWLLKASDISDIQQVESSLYNSLAVIDCGCGFKSDIADYLPLVFPYAGPYDNTNCEKPNTLNYFPDGCYQFTYEVYAKTYLPVLKCNYLFNHKLCEDQRVFVKKNGGWYDITDDGTNVGGNFSWSINQTLDQYTEWQIRASDGIWVITSGTLQKYSCSIDSEDGTSTTDQLLASKTLDIVFTAVIEKKMDDVAYVLTVDSGCNKPLRSGMDTNESIDLFSLARAKLLAAKRNTDCGCQCIMDTIESVSLLLDSITTTQGGAYAC